MDYESSMYELEFPAPQLSSADGAGPVLVHGLEGFTDAGHAVRLATTHLRESLEAELVASFDMDELLDYRSRRPLMMFKTDHFSDYTEPELNLWALKDTQGTPFLLLAGLEPDLRWEKFVTAVRLLAEQLGVRRTIGLSAIPMAIPHTRPLGMTAHASDRDLIGDHQRWPGELQVPGSASSLLEYRMAQHGHESVGFSVHVPHYLTQTAYPEAAQTLLESVAENAGLELPLAALTEQAARVREQVNEHIAGNSEVETVVAALERQYDSFVTAQERQSSLLASESDLPTGEELGAEFERFLAEQSGFGDGDANDGGDRRS
ncbi:PAC2 family [Nocardia otitidiscaviarum]|uniref:PAC2 family n=1 Tax=Nocardia otitidiscaviarum TaxID=1823 RepID=A0A378YUC7_9NOCA|nr:PAC2 family protein [Nocardia otitidiscaviarum]MBF6181326.1 PAC2 family protein [Nocardia otitidiscaviarum]MCP9624263.1 PAC2 family protein [Nocardia otitidiscaviarum]QDP80501.1 PAC2 family protein [Nocardia otitidiscaviarum]SUA80117.1 PAC2 family [Nocardia otitidiscaviarum]